mgnify:CR=1 FL=1
MEMVKVFFPELFLAVGSLFLLIVNSLWIKKINIKYFSFLVLLFFSFFTLLFFSGNISISNNYQTQFLIFYSHYLFRVILFSFGIILYISLYKYLISERYLNEFSFFLGATISFLSLLSSSQNLLIAFILIEAISFGFYLLISFYKRDLLCVEAGLKYFYLGTFSSIFFFTGLFLIYYSSLEINFIQVLNNLSFSSKILYFILGLILIFSSLIFKLGASPFHFWLPEVYQGSPLPVFPILISFSKLAFAVFLSNLILVFLISQGPFHVHKEPFYELFYIVSLLSMFIGNFLALKQKEVKRILAYSSISHMGYLLALFAIPWSTETLKFYYGYIFIYALTNLGILLSLFAIVDYRKIRIPIESYQEALKNKNFLLLFSLLIFIFSLAGLPPTAGFIAKFFLLLNIVKNGSYFLAFVFLLTSILSIYYYFRLIHPILTIFKDGLYKKDYEKVELHEMLMMFIVSLISIYLFLSTFKPSFIFFFE